MRQCAAFANKRRTSQLLAIGDDAPHVNLAATPDFVPAHHERVAVLEEEAIALRDAAFGSQPDMAREMAVFTVNRHEMARVDGLNHFPHLLPPKGTGNGNRADRALR